MVMLRGKFLEQLSLLLADALFGMPCLKHYLFGLFLSPCPKQNGQGE
jgi:hypothetical protein